MGETERVMLYVIAALIGWILGGYVFGKREG